MPSKKLNAKLLWMQFEDVLAPRLALTVKERAVYCHLLRHSLLVGRGKVRFAATALARLLGIGPGATRDAVRRLDELGALRVLKRSKDGHVAEMRLPERIRAIRSRKNRPATATARGACSAVGTERPRWRRMHDLEGVDFLKSYALRNTIHEREGKACFYCLRRSAASMRCIDHVVPRVRFGRNSYRNVVSSCLGCNSHKGDRPAEDFLRSLYRKGRLTPKELDGRLRALKHLAAGKLRPALQSE